MIWLLLAAWGAAGAAQAAGPEDVRFVRGGLLWPAQGATPVSPQVSVNGALAGPRWLPGGRGWLLEAPWRPREPVRISWVEAGQRRELTLQAPLRPEALAWLTLDWPAAGLAESGAADELSALRFSPDGRLLAMGSHQGRLAVLELASGALRWQAERPGRVIRQVAFAAEGRLLIAGEQGPEGRIAAYRLDRPGAEPIWHWDAAAELGSTQVLAPGLWAWVQQPGSYRLLAAGGDVMAAVTRSWRDETGAAWARSRLVRLDAATGHVRWRFPADAVAPMIMTWFSADETGTRMALPLQPPLGAATSGVAARASRIEIVGAGGAALARLIIPPVAPFPFAVFWRGVALHPDGHALAAAAEDGRGLLYTLTAQGWRAAAGVTLVQPMEIAGQMVSATNGTVAATRAEVIFATGPSYVPVAYGAGTPAGEHSRGNTLFAFTWQGRPRWTWPVGADLQGLELSAGGEVLAVLAGREAPQPGDAFAGLALLRLDQQGSGRDRLLYRFPLEGRVLYDAVAVAPDGGWVALGEAPRQVLGEPRPRGRARVWVLR